MKKTILVISIASFVFAFLSLAYSGLNIFMYYRTQDGSSSLYYRLQHSSVVFLMIGIVLAIIGIVFLIIYRKKQNIF